MCTHANEKYRKQFRVNNNYEDIKREKKDIVSRVMDAVEEGYTVGEALKTLGINSRAFRNALTDKDRVVLMQLSERNKIRAKNKKNTSKSLTKEQFREAMLSLRKH